MTTDTGAVVSLAGGVPAAAASGAVALSSAATGTIDLGAAYHNVNLWTSASASGAYINFAAAAETTHAVLDDAIKIDIRGTRQPVRYIYWRRVNTTGSLYWLAW